MEISTICSLQMGIPIDCFCWYIPEAMRTVPFSLVLLMELITHRYTMSFVRQYIPETKGIVPLHMSVMAIKVFNIFNAMRISTR